MTSTATHPLVDRIARAAQDSRILFGESREATVLVNGRAVKCTSVDTLHSPGPQAQLEQRAAREAVQVEANRLLAAADHDGARALLVAVAEAEHAEHPQYAMYWDQHTLGVAKRRTAFKGGRAIERGDAILLGDLSERDWDDSGLRDWSAYSAGMGGDALLPERNAARVGASA